jgi:DNA-binding Lrp family transcriptional regulator
VNEFEKVLLNRIQCSFPVAEIPFQLLAEEFNTDEKEIILTIRRLKNKLNVIRTISAIFNPSKLGYVSTLIALQVDESQINSIAEKINKFPTVSHNYLRDNRFNIWFTFAAKSKQELENVINSFCQHNKIKKFLILPSIKTFKLNTIFNFTDNKKLNQVNVDKPLKQGLYRLSESDYPVIAKLQNDLPVISRPYKLFATELGIKEHELIEKTNLYLENAIIKRYCASIHHVNAGIKSNAMIVWSVDPVKIDITGRKVAELDFVSHCYERPVCPDWPYNLYTMVHSENEVSLMANIYKIEQITGASKKEILYSLKEFKKDRARYFCD